MPWKPGETGNAGGRPKKRAELAEKIRDMSDEHLERLRQIALNGADKDSTAAIKLLWSYGFGQPSLEITGKDGEPFRVSHALDLSKLTPEQLEQLKAIIRMAK